VNASQELKLPEVNESDNGRRRHFRLNPAQMIGVFSAADTPSDLTSPDRVIDFSLGGVALLTEKIASVESSGMLSIFYDRKEVHKLPVKVVNTRKVGSFRRLGLKIDTESPAYKLQKTTLEAMEFTCIERAEF
jgi:c-di-GMP-binding flagellar brake protein YcgR